MDGTGRVYTMTRLGAGDYLLPSNDGRTLWRLTRYEEDGSLEWGTSGGKTWQVRGWWWQVNYRPMPPQGTPLADLRSWNGWDHWAGPLGTRGLAIAEALAATPARTVRA